MRSRLLSIPLAVLLLLTVVGPSLVTAAPATPVASDAGGLGAMLGRLPARALGQNGAMVTYANLAGQLAALGGAAPQEADDDAARAAWERAIGSLLIPSTLSRGATLPEWWTAFGFDLFDIDQAVAYAAPPFAVTVLRGRYDPATLRATWERGGYRPIDLGAGDAYAVRDDNEIDFDDAGSRLALASLNVVALADDGSLIFSSTRDGVRGALAAIAGEAPSFADRVDVAPLIEAAPPDLVSALLVGGETFLGGMDPAAIVTRASVDDLATRMADERATAQQMPMIVAGLLGQTAGLVPIANDSAATPEATASKVVAAIVVVSPAAASAAAAVIEERLATRRAPSSGGNEADGPDWSALLAEWTVEAVAGQPVVVVEMRPAPDVSPLILVNLLFQRQLSFLAWSP